MAEPEQPTTLQGPAARRADRLITAIDYADRHPDDAGGSQSLDLAWNELGRLDDAIRVLVKFARHRDGCHCFICRRLTDDERRRLAGLLQEVDRG